MPAPISLWRICTDTPQVPATDLSGRDVAETGGRWNRPGVPLVYLSSSISLAVLETLAHLDLSQGLPQDRWLVRVQVPADALARAVHFHPHDPGSRGWDAKPEGEASIGWGSRWAASQATLLARVPSSIVPEETNVLLNPAHDAARTVRAEKLRPFRYDLRLA